MSVGCSGVLGGSFDPWVTLEAVGAPPSNRGIPGCRTGGVGGGGREDELEKQIKMKNVFSLYVVLSKMSIQSS